MTFSKYIGDSKMFEYHKHYKECQQLNKPFIKARISLQHGHYFVQIDLMTCNYELTIPELEEIKKFIQDEREFMHSTNNFNLEFHIDKELAWFDGISATNVNKFCDHLYDLTQIHHS
jgi:S-methylmethionine-dependent homocysteine/selenocysteine methylase